MLLQPELPPLLLSAASRRRSSAVAARRSTACRARRVVVRVVAGRARCAFAGAFLLLQPIHLLLAQASPVGRLLRPAAALPLHHNASSTCQAFGMTHRECCAPSFSRRGTSVYRVVPTAYTYNMGSSLAGLRCAAV